MSGGSSSSSTKPYAKWMKPYMKEMAERSRESLALFQPAASPLRQEASRELLDTMRGKYLTPDSNPYLAATADAIARRSKEFLGRALSGVTSQFSRAGMTGSTQAAKVLGETARRGAEDLTDATARLFMTNYQAERGAMPQAITQGLGLSQMDLDEALAMLGIGKGTKSSTHQAEGGLL